MAVYSFIPTDGAYGHGIATIDNEKGISSFEYIELGKYNGKQYIYKKDWADNLCCPIPLQWERKRDDAGENQSDVGEWS